MKSCFNTLSLLPLLVISWTSSLSALSVTPDNPLVKTSGRVEFTEEGHVLLGYSGTRLRLAFEGESSVTVKLRSVGQSNWLNVYLDGQRLRKLEITREWQMIQLVDKSSAGLHTLELVKATEGYEGNIEIAQVLLTDHASLQAWPNPETRRIEFIGDSITCGYGIEADNRDAHWSPSTENFCDNYAWLTAQALQADYLVVARSGIGMRRNYNGPRIGNQENLPFLYERTFFNQPTPLWEPTRFTPDVVCINLGTNDFSTTGVEPAAFEAAYAAFVQRILSQYDQAKIVCLLGPMLNAPEVKSMLLRIAEQANQTLTSPRVYHFEMTAQGPLGYGADWHPSQAQAKLNAEELTAYLRGLLHW